MSRTTTSAIFTTDFRHEFEAETHQLLRRRFLWFAGCACAIVAVKPLADALFLIFGSAPAPAAGAVAARMGFPLLKVLVYAACLVIVSRRRHERATLLTFTQWLVVFDGTVSIVASEVAGAGGIDASWQWKVFFVHLLASAFLPWTPWEAIRPMLPLVGLGAVAVLVGKGSGWEKFLAIHFGIVAGVPGTLLCWMRHSRRLENSKLRFFQRRYGEMRQELFNARQLHEALLPRPCATGPVRFRYRYEPMRQIGGDYVYAFNCPPSAHAADATSLVVLDVTGHGIPAALTVNRLHGELERVFAEDPDARPGAVLRLLNRYVHLTLATHSVYVTALCLRVDPGALTLEYASGGHPPAFLRGVDGTIEELDSTAFVLGACRDQDFDPQPQSRRFAPGDSLIAYTDGATEARNAQGRMFGINGVRRVLATAQPDPAGGWPEAVLRAVDLHRSGPPKDDTLIVELSRPLAGAEALPPLPPTPARPHAASRSASRMVSGGSPASS